MKFWTDYKNFQKRFRIYCNLTKFLIIKLKILLFEMRYVDTIVRIVGSCWLQNMEIKL